MELHCHNVFSNYMNDSPRIPFDCGVTIEDQLSLAHEKKMMSCSLLIITL